MKYYKRTYNHPSHPYRWNEIYPEEYKEEGFLPVWESNTYFPERWQEVTEKDYLLQEAKKRYPEGTRFISPTNKYTYISTGNLYWSGITGNSIFNGGLGDGCVYWNGQWAEIIEEPEKEMEELKINKEKVLEAASKCSQAKATLQVLFPEAFKEEEKGFFTKEGLSNLSDLLMENSGLMCEGEDWDKIPGYNSDDKARTISKLIYNTYIK